MFLLKFRSLQQVEKHLYNPHPKKNHKNALETQQDWGVVWRFAWDDVGFSLRGVLFLSLSSREIFGAAQNGVSGKFAKANGKSPGTLFGTGALRFV